MDKLKSVLYKSLTWFSYKKIKPKCIVLTLLYAINVFLQEAGLKIEIFSGE